jgi:hypothetical protein
MSHRPRSRAVSALQASLVLACAGLSTSAFAQSTGTLVALPDTQFYSENVGGSRFQLFLDQTNWVKNFRSPYKIDFVSHLGDIVQNGSVLAEWTRADQAIDVLDTIVPELPYSVVPGNHDFATTGNKSTLLANYLANFGPARYAGKTWFRGATANGWNSYQIITIGGREYLHLALEWQPAAVTAGQDDAIAWAQSVINTHPGMPTILSTHEYITDDLAFTTGRSGAGEAIWTNLVRSNNQIFITLNGHFHAGTDGNDGERYEVATNNFGNPVHQLLSDYQAYPNGGDGYLRMYVFNEPSDNIHVISYTPKNNATNTAGAGASRFFLASPATPYAMPAGLPALTSGTVQVDANSRFDMSIDFDTRFIAPPPPPPPPPSPFITLTFREGVDGYVGTQDTYAASATASTSFGSSAIVKSDTVDGSPAGPVHGLLRFDNLFGTGAGQIDPAAVLDTALLNVTTTNASANASRFHNMLAAWTESATWTSLGAGVQADGVEAQSAIVASITPSSTGVASIDVLSSLSQWQAGLPNLGWAILPTGSDGWDFTSSEGTSASRPQLAVRILADGISRSTFKNGVNGYTGTLDTELSQSQPTTSFGNAASVSVDSDDPNGSGSDNHFLIQFQDILGSNPGQVPVGSNVVINKALLVVEGFDAGDGAGVHRLLQSWDESVTWANSFGGNGVQSTGIEAVALDDSTVSGSTGRVEIDVTASVQAWATNSAPNHGWALLPRGNNGWDVRTSEGSNPPELRVYYSIKCPADLNGDGEAEFADFLDFFNCYDLALSCADLDNSTEVDFGDFLAFFNSYDVGCGSLN